MFCEIKFARLLLQPARILVKAINCQLGFPVIFVGDFVKVAEIRRGGRKLGRRNTKNSLLIPVFCCMEFAVESYYTARNKYKFKFIRN